MADDGDFGARARITRGCFDFDHALINFRHFLCEQAQNLIEEGNVEDASDKLRAALKADPRCVRASLAQAELAMTAGAYEAAIRHLQRIETQDIAFLPEAIAPLEESFRALDRLPEMIEYLERLFIEVLPGPLHVVAL